MTKKKMTAADYRGLAAAFPSKKKVTKRRQESIDQRLYVRALNLKQIGFFYRVKSLGTFDRNRKRYRRNAELVPVPEICGYLFNPCLPVYIEVKRVQRVEKKKRLIFKVRISEAQKSFLLEAHRAGARAGIAFNLEDCIAIASADPNRFPRHPRTYFFLPDEEVEAYAEEYRAQRQALSARCQDPLDRDIYLPLED